MANKLIPVIAGFRHICPACGEFIQAGEPAVMEMVIIPRKNPRKHEDWWKIRYDFYHPACKPGT